MFFFLLLLGVAASAPVSFRHDEGCFERLLRCRNDLDFSAATRAVMRREKFLLPHSCLVYVGYCKPDFPNLLSAEIAVMVPLEKPDGSTTYVQRPDVKPVSPEGYVLLHTLVSEMRAKISSRTKPLEHGSQAAEAYVSYAHPTEESSTPS